MKPFAVAPLPRLVLAAAFVTAAVGCSGGSGQGTTSTQDPDVSSSGGTGDGTSGSPEESDGSVTTGTGAASGSLDQADIARRVFDPRLVGFGVQVFYERGAEPYTGALGLTSNDTWDVTRESYRDLFAAHAGRSVSVPSALDEMQAFADQGTVDWSIATLIELGESMASPLIEDAVARVAVIFLNGLYDGRSDVLGIHPAGHPFSFVFKDVVRSVGGGATTQRYAEQSTVVHEIGHSIGFVDNGVPMVNAHEDAEHPHHTTDEDGVMYWAVENRDGALAFLTGAVTGARLSLFGPASLLDAQNFMPTD